MRFFIFGFMICLLASNCSSGSGKRVLPILGVRDVAPNGDTIYHKIPDFKFVDQDSQFVTNATFDGKIYVVDFFFIHCPTICPKVKANGLRIYEKYLNDDRFMLLSHTIDIKHDTVAALKRHADKLGIQSAKWRFVTGDHDAVYGIAEDYLSVAKEDDDAAGGFTHSGRIMLIDKNRHIRSYCDGTDAKDVDRFMKDIDLLLEEQFPNQAKKN
ncbi:MAG: SCO family protein [Bacteroidota bacterium]